MLDIVGLLQTEKNEFTRSERALTEILLADVDSVLKISIVDLAAQADVSPPTVTRFCRRLGCDSYADFKVRLAPSRFVGQRYFAPAPRAWSTASSPPSTKPSTISISTPSSVPPRPSSKPISCWLSARADHPPWSPPKPKCACSASASRSRPPPIIRCR